MKRIEAIIRSEQLQAVIEALGSTGYGGMTVFPVLGHGLERGMACSWRGKEYRVDLVPKTSVVLVVHDHEVQDALDTISGVANTGTIGDGKIFVTPVETVVRIRTGEVGGEAV